LTGSLREGVKRQVEARIKRAWKGRRDDNMEREKRKSDEVLIVESKNGVC